MFQGRRKRPVVPKAILPQQTLDHVPSCLKVAFMDSIGITAIHVALFGTRGVVLYAHCFATRGTMCPTLGIALSSAIAARRMAVPLSETVLLVNASRRYHWMKSTTFSARNL
jgi:hypothetical protein